MHNIPKFEDLIAWQKAGELTVSQLISIAKSSWAELRSHLYLAFAANYVDHEKFESIKVKAEELSRILGGLRSAFAKQR